METPTTATASTGLDSVNFDVAFQALLNSSNQHHALKEQQAPLSDLWSSRCALMDRRELVSATVARLR